MNARFEAKLDLVGDGWLSLDLRAGIHRTHLNVSCLGDGPVELVIALVAFFTNGTSQSVLFELEPGKLALRLEWPDRYPFGSLLGKVRIRIGEGVPTVGLECESSEDDVDLDLMCNSTEIGESLTDALIAFIERYGSEVINQRWNKGLPAPQMSDHHLWLLRDLKMRFSLYTHPPQGLSD